MDLGEVWVTAAVLDGRRTMLGKTLKVQRLSAMLLKMGRPLAAVAAVTLVAACTQETQNQLSRAVRNWTGDNGVLEVYAGEKLVKRFVDIDKLSTARATDGSTVPRPYRFGYGVLDANFNGVRDPDEKRVYFEFSDYSTQYVFYESPK